MLEVCVCSQTWNYTIPAGRVRYDLCFIIKKNEEGDLLYAFLGIGSERGPSP